MDYNLPVTINDPMFQEVIVLVLFAFAGQTLYQILHRECILDEAHIV
jgi:hypothetical protein